MFGLERFLGRDAAKTLKNDKDAIAGLLKTDRAALEAFESAYAKHALSEADDNFFHVNSRAASGQRTEAALSDATDEEVAKAGALVERIVAELMSQTSVYRFDGKLGQVHRPLALPAGTAMVSNDDLKGLPTYLRPELTGELMKVDINVPSYQAILGDYERAMNETDPKKRKSFYAQFRAGLDILDLDEITYRIIGTNKNSMGYWLPALVEACRSLDFFRIPATSIARVPLTLLQLTRQEYSALTPTTIQIVDRWAYEAFKLDEQKEYFIKTGTYSSKFDYRNAHVHEAKEVRELGEYLLYIHYQALCMAHYTVKPHPIYGVSTTNEWVVREYIPDKEDNPCIYHGMPLHTEYRVFVDCDTAEVIGIAPYWDPETMLKRFSADGNIHEAHDYVIYKAHEETLMQRYEENKDQVIAHIRELLPRLNLAGQWSIDVMQNGGDFWLIDMALAEQSAFYDRVPPELRRPTKEDWIPKLTD